MDSQTSDMPPPPLPSPSHGPSTSMDRRDSKRLSLNFQLPASTGRKSRPASMISASPVSSRPLSPESEPSASTDPSAFLTALAAQERKVFELKEELQKAEMDLSKLKTQWAVHEATKKRNEIHRSEPLRDMSSPTLADFDSAAIQRSRTSREEERKKAMYIRTKPSQRKVFAGGRHTRALSLLSPAGLEDRAGSLDSPSDVVEEALGRHSKPIPLDKARIITHVRAKTQGGNRDIMHTGKQIVGDLREGLWTFIEDLKQATVGDEAVSGLRSMHGAVAASRTPMPQKKRVLPAVSPSTARRRNNLIDIDGLIQEMPTHATPAIAGSNASKAEADEDDDGWENWDSPAPKTSASLSFSTTAGSSPRTSVSSDASKDKTAVTRGAQDQLPWPVLTKLSPSTLTRTASNLMAEWERSLTPPVEEQMHRQSTGLSPDGKDRKAD